MGTSISSLVLIVLGTIRINLVWAVVLVIGLALWALQARPDLSSDTDTISHLDSGDLVSNLDGLSNDFVTSTNSWVLVYGKLAVAPTASDCVDIGTADTTGVNENVDISITELLWLELLQA